MNRTGIRSLAVVGATAAVVAAGMIYSDRERGANIHLAAKWDALNAEREGADPVGVQIVWSTGNQQHREHVTELAARSGHWDRWVTVEGVEGSSLIVLTVTPDQKVSGFCKITTPRGSKGWKPVTFNRTASCADAA